MVPAAGQNFAKMSSFASEFSDGSTLLDKGDAYLKPDLPDWAIMLNEYVWCYFSLTMNCMMSILLMGCMFLKVYTFTGAIDHVAVITLSLYFVFDLDDKVMQSDPKLRPMYRRTIVKQSELRDTQPRYIMPLGAVAVGISRMLLPVGIVCLVLLGWRNVSTGVTIGSDPLSEVTR